MRPVALLLGLFLLGAWLLAGAAPAGAHAVVVATTPGDGAVLPTAPPEASVQFTERVSVDLGGLTLLDAEGNQVELPDAVLSAGGEVVSVSLPSDLEDGTYVLSWRVVSADGHPVNGSIVFGVGEATVIDAGSVAALTSSGDTGYEVAAWLARFVLYVAALLAAGLGGFLAFVHDQAEDRWKLTPIVRAASLVAGLAMVATIALQAALLTGDGVEAMTDLDTLRKAMTEGLGWQAVVLLVGLALVHLSTDTAKLLTAQILAFYGGLTVSAAFVFWGHAREAPDTAVAIGADVLHTATAAVWFGGLVGLVLTLRRRFRDIDHADPVSTGAVLSRFSSVAAGSVVLLLVAGLALSWQEVGSLEAYRTTTYGRVLMAKTFVFLLVVAAAAYNRFRLMPSLTAPTPEGGPEPGDAGPEPTAGGLATIARTGAGRAHVVPIWRRIASTARLEAIGLVVVLGLTAALVYITPARVASQQVAVVFNQTAPAGDLQVNLVVTPGEAGPNDLHIQYLDDGGRPIDQPQTLQVQYSLPDKDVPPVTVDVPRVAPGHFIVDDLSLPIAGTWTIDLVARLSDFEQERTSFEVPVT